MTNDCLNVANPRSIKRILGIGQAIAQHRHNKPLQTGRKTGMSADIIPIASTGPEKADTASPPRPCPRARYQRALTGAALRCVRVARIIAECTGWCLLAGLAALAIT